MKSRTRTIFHDFRHFIVYDESLNLPNKTQEPNYLICHSYHNDYDKSFHSLQAECRDRGNQIHGDLLAFSLARFGFRSRFQLLCISWLSLSSSKIRTSLIDYRLLDYSRFTYKYELQSRCSKFFLIIK